MDRGKDEAVKVLGGWSVAEVRAKMAEASVFVQYSLTDRLGSIEGWGVSLAEAAASGLPAVATNHGGIPDQVSCGRTRFLGREGDWEAMAESMLMLAGDPALRLRIGRAGRENIEMLGNLSLQIGKLRGVLEEASGR